MRDFDEWRTVWSAAAHLEQDSVNQWLKENYPSLSREEAVALHLTQLETTVTQRRGGNISVTVSVLARQAFRSEVFYFFLQRVNKGVIIRQEPSQP